MGVDDICARKLFASEPPKDKNLPLVAPYPPYNLRFRVRVGVVVRLCVMVRLGVCELVVEREALRLSVLLALGSA